MSNELVRFDKNNWSEYIEADFSREIWCVLGFPIDNTVLDEVRLAIDEFIKHKKQCVVSTVNLNFSDCAVKKHAFRNAVNNSEIVVIDGFPVFLVSKYLGLPIRERTSGSVLINYLLRNEWDTNYSVYWYGSGPGIAQKAYEATNQLGTGHKAVGHFFPGYGDVDSMKLKEALDSINETSPDLLLLALSAKKGCVWIEDNRLNLNANVLSHIGSVLDFFAGTEKESPPWTRKIGMEWLWKALLKPALFKRFFFEGLTFLKVLLFNVFPLKYLQFRYSNLSNFADVTFDIQASDGECSITPSGSIGFSNYREFGNTLKEAIVSEKNIIIDFSSVDFIDNSAIGLLMLTKKYAQVIETEVTLANVNDIVKKLLKYNLVDKFFIFK